MQAIADEVQKIEPDTWLCSTDRVTSELSKCSNNNLNCKNGYPAGKTVTSCIPGLL